MSTDAGTREACWRAAADAVEAALDAGDDVALVNLGDVSLYATAYYILDLIRADGYVAVMLPGVASICAVAARLGRSLTRMEAGAILPPAAPIWLDALRLPGTKVPRNPAAPSTKLWTRSRRRGFDRAALVADCGLPDRAGLRRSPQLRSMSYLQRVLVR